MPDQSIFSPTGNNGQVRGGLDRYLAPAGIDDSNLPLDIADPHNPPEPNIPVDCDGADKDSAVCQIAKAEQDLGHQP